MQRYKFRFDNVLRFRKQQLQRAERELMMSRSRMETLRRELETLRASVVEAVTRSLRNERMPDESARLSEYRVMSLRSQHMEVEKALHRATVAHAGIQEEYRTRYSQVEALQTLQQQQWTEYVRRLAVEEQARLDDDVVRRWNTLQNSLKE